LRKKRNYKSKSLVDQKQHLALEVPTKKQLTLGGRENTPAKQHQAKARATKAQQDIPINVALNN
jgi:hypothetical protein